MTRLLLGGLLSLALGSVHAELFVPAVLSSDMVLPAENATVWGTSTPGTPIRLRLISRGSAPLERSTVADAKGGWAFHLLHLEPSLEPADLTISGDGGNKTLSGVLFGLLVLGRVLQGWFRLGGSAPPRTSPVKDSCDLRGGS